MTNDEAIQIERQTFERARDLCLHHAKLYRTVHADREANAAQGLADELDRLSRGEPVSNVSDRN